MCTRSRMDGGDSSAATPDVTSEEPTCARLRDDNGVLTEAESKTNGLALKHVKLLTNVGISVFVELWNKGDVLVYAKSSNAITNLDCDINLKGRIKPGVVKSSTLGDMPQHARPQENENTFKHENCCKDVELPTCTGLSISIADIERGMPCKSRNRPK